MGKKILCIFCLTTAVLISCDQKREVARSIEANQEWHHHGGCLLYTSPSPRDRG